MRYRLSRLAWRRAPAACVDATCLRAIGVFVDPAFPFALDDVPRPADSPVPDPARDPAATDPGGDTPLLHAAASRSERSSAALVRAATARTELTRASASSNSSALSAARRFCGRAWPRPPAVATRAPALLRYCFTYFVLARRTRVCRSTSSSSSRLAMADRSVAATSSHSCSFRELSKPFVVMAPLLGRESPSATRQLRRSERRPNSRS
jgi:hypothetical protein